MAKNTLLRKERWQMARAKRHFLPGQVWHISHRCHKKRRGQGRSLYSPTSEHNFATGVKKL